MSKQKKEYSEKVMIRVLRLSDYLRSVRRHVRVPELIEKCEVGTITQWAGTRNAAVDLGFIESAKVEGCVCYFHAEHSAEVRRLIGKEKEAKKPKRPKKTGKATNKGTVDAGVNSVFNTFAELESEKRRAVTAGDIASHSEWTTPIVQTYLSEAVKRGMLCRIRFCNKRSYCRPDFKQIALQEISKVTTAGRTVGKREYQSFFACLQPYSGTNVYHRYSHQA